MKDYLIRGTSLDGKIRFFLANTTDLSEKARKIQNCLPLSAIAFSKVLTATSIMGSMLKSDQDTISIQFKGNGPIGAILAVSDNTGNVKGYLHNPMVKPAETIWGKLSIADAVGRTGLITIIKDLGMKEPYIGQIPIVNGEVTEDLMIYFVNSEQTPTLINLEAYVEEDGSISAAGGYMIQVMPEADEVDVEKLEVGMGDGISIVRLLQEGLEPQEIMNRITNNMPVKINLQVEIDYKCNCSRERLEKVLLSIGKNELNDIIEQQGNAELVCHYCNEKYTFDKNQLEKLLLNAGDIK